MSEAQPIPLPRESATEGYTAELTAYAEHATIGSPELLAINHMHNYTVAVDNREKEIKKFRSTPIRYFALKLEAMTDLVVAKLNIVHIEKESAHNEVTMPGYYEEVRKVIKIVNQLRAVRMPVNKEESYYSPEELVIHDLAKARRGAIYRESKQNPQNP